MKKVTKKVALYNPFLDILGGGERYILSILKVLDDLGFKIDIFWNKDLQQEIKNRFGLNYKNLNFVPNIFKNKSLFSKIAVLKNYNLFFYITNGSYFFSSAKKNFIYAMIPDKNLYQLNFLNHLKLINYRFFTHSFFNQKNLKKWGIESFVLYPYIDDIFFTENSKKDKIILVVGRFFPHLHSKNHHKVIEIFKKLKKIDKSFSQYKLILAGGLKKEDVDYFLSLKNFAQDDPSIIFKLNIPFNELLSLYKTSAFYWHFTGYGEDENKNPQNVEHLGISPLEAMASKNIVFCYSAGGPKELIKNGLNGFLFKTEDDLIKKMKEIQSNEKKAQNIRENGQNYVKKYFSYENFRKNVLSFFCNK